MPLVRPRSGVPDFDLGGWEGAEPRYRTALVEERGLSVLRRFPTEATQRYQVGFPPVSTHVVGLTTAGVVEAVARHEAGNPLVRAPRGLLTVVPAGRPMDWELGPGQRFAVLQIHVAPRWLHAPFDEGGAAPELVPVYGVRDVEMERIALGLISELRYPLLFSAAYLDAVGQALGSVLVRRHSAGTVVREGSPALAPYRLARARDYVEAHLGQDVGLDEIAGAAGLSPFHFSRAFRKATGQSPVRYLLGRRIERAKDLLTGSPVSLAEVALAVGFSGQSHFTTAFRRATGLPPGAWRRLATPVAGPGPLLRGVKPACD